MLTAACSDPVAQAPIVAPTRGTIAPLAQLAATESGASVLTLPPGFVPIDTRAVLLPVAPAYDVTLPPIPVYGGKSNITGVITGPDGPVDGATVRLERFVGNRGGYIEVTTGKDGVYNARDLLGGHFRLRSWLAPDLTTFDIQTTFIPAEVDRTIDIPVQKFDANHLQAALTVGDPHVGDLVILRTLLVNEDVSKDEGIVEGKGIKDVEIRVAPDGNANWDLLQKTVKTDDNGFADFVAICKATGAWPLKVRSPDLVIDVAMPECLPALPSTSVPPAAGGTSTTEPPPEVIPPFAVGNTFKVPYPGPVPAGTYVSKDPACATQFEVLVQGHWIKVQVTSTSINSTYPMRDFTSLNALPGCSFKRTK